MRLVVRFALFALVLRAAIAQTQPDVAEILKKVSEVYKAASQYEIVADATSRGAGTAPIHMLLAFRLPSRYRMEGALPGLTGDDAAFSDAVIVCDGSFVWFYLPEVKSVCLFRAQRIEPGRFWRSWRPETGSYGPIRHDAVPSSGGFY